MNDDDKFPEHLALKIVADLLVFQLGADHQPIKCHGKSSKLTLTISLSNHLILILIASTSDSYFLPIGIYTSNKLKDLAQLLNLMLASAKFSTSLVCSATFI